MPVYLVTEDIADHRLVTSLSRPGGNITGLSSMGFDLAVKRLEVLKEAIPQLSKVALLVNPNNAYDAERQATELQPPAEKLHVSVKAFEAREPDQLQHAMEDIAADNFGAVVVAQNAMFYNERKRVAELAIANRLATMAPADVFLPAGALMSYGPVWSAIFRNAAGYVDKIVRKGANPAELPIQQPTQFRFVINLKTAKLIGLEISPVILSRADEVIE